MEYQRTLRVLQRGCTCLNLPTSAAGELLRLLELKRDAGKHASRELGQSGQLDELLHWLLLNTTERDVVEAYTGKIRHTTMATETDERKAEKRLAALNALSFADWTPDLSLWQEPGTALDEIMWMTVSDDFSGRQFNHYFTRQYGLAALQELLADLGYTIMEAHRQSSLDALEPTAQQAEIEKATLQLWCHTLTGKRFPFRVPLGARVQDCKRVIQGLEGIPSNTQRLIFAGKQLDDGHTLAHYNIQKDAASGYLPVIIPHDGVQPQSWE